MSAIFKIDQPGWVPAPPPLPVWDRARRDIQLVGTGGPVTFTARDPAGSYLWELISEPPGPVTPIVGPNLPACQVAFTKTGGYLMRLTVDAGIPGSEDISIRYVGVPLANSQLPIPAFNELDFDNSIDPLAIQGSAEKLTEFFKWVDAHIGSGMGNLPQTLTVYVDGGRTDVYVEDGTFAFPFKTIQPAIALAQTLADAAHGEACVHIRPWLYTEINTVLPSNVHIDAELGASLIPAGPSHGLIVIPGNYNTQLGVTIIRGLSFAGNGGGVWPTPFPMWGLYMPASPPPPGVNIPVVFPIDCGIGALQNACGICIEQGAVYLTDAGGMFSDSAGGTNAIAARVGTPGGGPPMFGAILMVGMFNLSASETMFDIHPGGGVFATGTKLDNNTGLLSDALVRIDGGPGMGALFVGKNLRPDGDMSSMVKQTGNSFVLLDTSAGGTPNMGNFVADIFDIRQGFLSLAGGAYKTTGGNGLALRATDGPVSCWTRDTDIIADNGVNDVQVLLTQNNVNLQTYNTRFKGELFVPGRTYARMGHTTGWAYLDGGNIEGGSGGAPPPATILDVLPNSNVWLTGGIDINATHAQDVALNVQALASVFHGHANIRMGHVVMAGTEMALTSSFANVSMGKYNALTKWTSRATLAEVAGELGYEHGSILVVTGGAKPLVYINHGTDLARDWRLLADYVRVQVDQCGAVNLNGTTRIAPAYLTWAHADYDDNPPYVFTAPSTIITLSEDGDYRLSYNVPWQTDALLAFGTSVGVMWEYRPPAGIWTEIPNTLTFDTAANIINDRGCNDLPSYEKYFVAGTELRVKAFIDTGVVGNVYINNDPAENWAWARVEKGGVGGSGGGSPVTDWTVEFVTANRVLDATDHKKTFIVLVDTPNTVTITLPLTPFVGQEIRIVHGGQLTYPGPGSGHLTVLPAAPGDKGIGVSDSDYAQLDAEGGGAVVHLLCIDSGGGYWGSRFWGCGAGSGEWWDATNLGIHPAPPYMSNQFYLNFQSPFNIGAGGPSAIQLNDPSAVADGVFSFAFGYIVNTSREYSLAFGHLARTNWVGESAFASGGFYSWGSAQRSEVNLYGETTPVDPTGAITPTGIGGLPLTVEPEKVYACELLVAAVRALYFPMDPPLAAGWKMEFLVHGRDLGQNAVIVGTINKTQFSRDPSPIIDTWDVNVSMGGPGLFATDILVTVTQGVDVGGAVRWDAVLRSAQVVATIPT